MIAIMFPPRRYLPPIGTPRASARQWALAAWRGTDVTAAEISRADRFKPAGSVLTRVLADLRMDRRLAEAEILRAWNQLDPNIVAHAQPTGLRNGTLFVTVDSSVWLSEIVRYRRREILDRLQHSFGRELVARISYRVG